MRLSREYVSRWEHGRRTPGGFWLRHNGRPRRQQLAAKRARDGLEAVIEGSLFRTRTGFSGDGRFAWSEEPRSVNWLAA